MIFFGAAPGVGKTYGMLEAARNEARGSETRRRRRHRRDTRAIRHRGARHRPRAAAAVAVEHRGVNLEELDLDAALRDARELILVDELAHTNAPGSRHLKRWQDVEELLDAGIDVFTTLNVQHLESLNDVVAQITGVFVRETVPDAVFDQAYEVRVIDLPVDHLLERLAEGKIYVPRSGGAGARNFFHEGNLIALRELALRRTAERVEAKMRGYKAEHGIEEIVARGRTGPRLRLVESLGRTPRARARGAWPTSLHAELVGVYVETPASLRMTSRPRPRGPEHSASSSRSAARR